jgi:hypothetical protein
MKKDDTGNKPITNREHLNADGFNTKGRRGFANEGEAIPLNAPAMPNARPVFVRDTIKPPPKPGKAGQP